jgi:catechol 2,3-dioxygenase-like lactoylglutathione lyase family enzyme
MVPTLATLKMMTLDSSDARRDARFWAEVLGWEVVHEQDEYAMLRGGDVALGFGTVADHQPPTWPNERGTKQFHLDLAVDDLDTGVEACVAAGATLAAEQPGETWRVLLDPSGHPFCLTLAANWG